MLARLGLFIVALTCASTAWTAEVLYAASMRSQLERGTGSTAGRLYRVDPATAKSVLVGTIRIDGIEPIGVTGLSDHPLTGIMYGVTSRDSPTFPDTLVTIDPTNGNAHAVGTLGATASDIAFDRKGTLYAWLKETSQLATVDLSTGLAHPLGRAGPPGEPGGVTIDGNDRVYVVGSGATGSIDVFDVATSTLSKGPDLKGTPFSAGMNSITFSSEGVIYAVNTNLGSPANTLLVKIDPRTGAVTVVGPLPLDTDALVFLDPPWKLEEFLFSRAALSFAAALACLLVGLGVVVASARKGER